MGTTPFDGNSPLKKVQSHLGVNLHYMFNEKISVMAAYRLGLGSGDDYKTSTVSGGAAVYF